MDIRPFYSINLRSQLEREQSVACGTSRRFDRSQLRDYALGSGSLGLDLEGRTLTQGAVTKQKITRSEREEGIKTKKNQSFAHTDPHKN